MYRIIQNYYVCCGKYINTHLLLENNLFLLFYAAKYNYKASLSNIFLKKWFFLKI